MSKLNIAVIGKSGQLARSFQSLDTNHLMHFIDRSQLDLEDIEKIQVRLDTFFKENPIDILINTAAYTNVDKAEDEQKLAYKINALAPEQMAHWARKLEIIFVNFSTDYVFSGKNQNPNFEDSPTEPINVYGYTKLEGEKLVINANKSSLIIRTSWLFSPWGKNFLLTMLELQKTRDTLSVVYDQTGSPTFAPDLAKVSLEVIEEFHRQKNREEMILNLCNKGHTNWYEFAREIFQQAMDIGLISRIPEIKKIKSDDYPTKAIRPKYSNLNLDKFLTVFNYNMPNWQNAVKRCLEELKNKGTIDENHRTRNS